MNNTTYFGHGLSDEFAYSVAGCFTCIMVLGVTFNVALITTILRDRTLQTVNYILIVNLSAGDLITTLINVPFDIDFLFRGYFPYSRAVCGVKEVTFFLSLPLSTFNLLLVTLERWITIKYPLKSKLVISKVRICQAVILTWLYSTLFSLFPLFHKGTSAIFVENGFCFLKSDMSYFYVYIAVNFFCTLSIVITLNASFLSKIYCKKDERIVRRRSNVNTLKFIALLTCNILVCWLVYIVIVIANILTQGRLPREWIWIGNVVNYSNVVLNPLIYGLMRKSIRLSLKHTRSLLSTGSSGSRSSAMLK